MNPHKGDVPLVVGGKTYTLCYSHLALVKLENLLNKSIMEVLNELQEAKQNVRIGTIVALLWAGLQRHHSKMSFDEAAELLDESDNGAAGVLDIVGVAFEKAFEAPGTKGTNPQMNGSAGTGTQSLSSTSVTAMSQTPSGI